MDRMKKVRKDVDMHQPDSFVKVFAEVKPDLVVNCIGIIKQVLGAQDPLSTITTNALLPHRIALLCGAEGARMMYLMEKGDYRESDVSNATDLYGRTNFLVK